jgi:ATPase subunit of ABC transporter with duplicated ATPase domains
MELGEDEYLLEAHSVCFCPQGSEGAVLSRVDLLIPENCRIGVIGRNGAGKSTLLKLLAHGLNPLGGEIVRQAGLQLAYMGQHDAEQLLLPETPLCHLQKAFPQVKEDELQATLEEFGMCGSVAHQSMDTLSGGQRIRVALASLSVERPHLLILDEPTNHLDIYAIEALIDALKAFKGGVIFVTHNQSLLQEVAQQVVTVRDGIVSMEHLSNQVLAVKNCRVTADNTVLLD